jgi:peptidoglycan/xylan/chitin deacetylase (PgdA/CDA1 family)
MKVPVLMYHMVRESSHPAEKRYACSPAMFRRQMAYLKKSGYRVISLGDLATSVAGGTQLNGREVVITFDDGFRDNYTNALPVLRQYGFSAAVFVVSGSVGGANEWMVQNGYPRREMASWDELREMAEQGVEIGSHTVTHCSLDTADERSATCELRDSRQQIGERLGRPVRFFAYPYGRLTQGTAAMVKAAGYDAACSTRSGFNNAGTDPFILRRLEIYGTDSLWRFALKLAWGTNDASLPVIGRYYLSRVKERLA